MSWTPPAWCKVAPNAPRAVITLQSQTGQPRRHDLGNNPYYVLTQEDPTADSSGTRESYWHAVVLRDECGNCYIMDLQSEAGTYMNKQKLEPHKPEKWTPGVVVVLGIPKLHDKATLEVGERPVALKGQKRSLDEATGRESTETAAAKRQQVDVAKAAKTGKCDKCDGKHETDACPHFKKARENHKDAWASYGSRRPTHLDSSGKKFFLRTGKEVRQPGDGSCLFHSLCFGLNRSRAGSHFRAGPLRKELASFIQRHPKLEIAGDTLEEWVRWDARSTVPNYTRRMASSGWGGGIEMAACCLSQKVNVHVYERRRSGFERISCFDCPQKTKQTIHVLYQGGVHYDALLPGQ